MIGFYPIRVTTSTDEDGKKIFVECTHKTDLHLTGTIIDEQGQPVAYANIAVLNPSDSTLLCGGVSNESGYFAIPLEQERVLARISYFISNATALNLAQYGYSPTRKRSVKSW